MGSSVTALSVTRALGRAGIAVTVLDDGMSDCPINHSRYCREFVPVERWAADIQERWLAWLQSSRAGAVVVPAGDDGVELVARHRPELVAAGHLPVEGDDIASLAMLDKEATYAIAATAGIRAPRSVVVRSVEDLQAALATMDFPCAYKASQAHHFRRLLSLLPPDMPAKGGLATDAATMEELLVPVLELGFPMMLSEYVPGPGDDFYFYNTYLDERAEPLFQITTRKLRQTAGGFGNGTLHLTEWNAEVAAAGLAFARAAGVRGLANVEFKRDQRDGRFTLIECNVRPTMANDLILRSGIDLTLIAYDRAVGRPVAQMDHVREGVRLWDPVEDWKVFRQGRRDGELTTAAWLRSVAHPVHLRVFDVRDPGPIATRLVWRARAVTQRVRSPASSRGQGC